MRPTQAPQLIKETVRGRHQQYPVPLDEEERNWLLTFINKGDSSARTLKRAHMLLLASEGKNDREGAEALHTCAQTVGNMRRKYADGGLEAALSDRPRPGGARKLTATGEATRLALACSDPPDGRVDWTMQMLADKLIERTLVASISDETVRRTLKKTSKPWQKKPWCLGKVTADFMWRMEHILDLYGEPYDPKRPQLCFDEMPDQWLTDVREALPPEPGKARRQDYEYERQGTCNVLLAFEPLTGQRYVGVRETRTHADFAHFRETLAHTHSPDAQELRVVRDNLSPQTPVAVYETFVPQEARALTQKIAFHYTPVHGSWLNMAECEFAVLSRQCLKQRIATQDHLDQIAQQWAKQRTEKRFTVNWQFTTDNARAKFKRFYPH